MFIHYFTFYCHQVVLLCSAWCCGVTHSIHPWCALMICDCILSCQSFIISDFFQDQAKVLPLCTYLTIVIETMTDRILIRICSIFVFLCGCWCQSCVYLVGFGERSFCRSPPPSLVPLHCALFLLHFHPPANGFVLLKTSMFFNTLLLSQNF